MLEIVFACWSYAGDMLEMFFQNEVGADNLDFGRNRNSIIVLSFPFDVIRWSIARYAK